VNQERKQVERNKMKNKNRDKSSGLARVTLIHLGLHTWAKIFFLQLSYRS